MSKFIIVERDAFLMDCGVFTGQIQIVDSRLIIEGYGPLQVMDAVSSPDIEHAFLFNTTWDAWRFAKNFQPVWDSEQGRFLGHRRWCPRKDGDYFPGECKQGIDARNPTNRGPSGIPQELLLAASESGFVQGRKSAFAEMRSSGVARAPINHGEPNV